MFIIFTIFLPFILAQHYTHSNRTLYTDRQYYANELNHAYNLSLTITYETQTQLDITITDLNNTLFTIPTDVQAFKYNDIPQPEIYSSYEYQVLISDDPFTLTIIRQDSQEIIFKLQDLIVTQLYQEFNITIPSKYLFGLGERNQKGFRFKEGTYTLFAKDVPELMEDGKSPGKGVYSSHPVYLMREKSGKYHVVFFKSSSPMDIIHKDSNLNYKQIGGALQFKLFLGDYDPETAIKLYHEYLGGWALHPFWAMGYHHSRWPMKSAAKLIDTIHKHKDNNIPLDTIWSDLDYMKDRQIFSVNDFLFSKQEYATIQQELRINYIPLIDVAVGVKYGKEDKGFREGINLDIFLRSPATGARFRGNVWPGSAYFPDFFHPNTTIYWRSMMKELYIATNFSGIWIDMNEPTNFCDGECKQANWNKSLDYTDVDTTYKNDPIHFPYIPGVSPLDKMTLPPHLKHYKQYLHKDVHNLYGFQESYETYMAQLEIGKPLPFIISRATFPGSGKYTQHWLGDNAATFDFMYLSVGQSFQFGIFGIPMVGADVCGFLRDTTEKLCARWAQVGALYPFMRNHNNDRAKDQEFYSLGPLVLMSAQRNIKLRYSLLRWYYTLFVRQNHTGTIFRPLFFEFIADSQVLQDDIMDTQIMLGSELMATPILLKGVTIRKAYFPQTLWFHLLTGVRIQKPTEHGQDHFVLCKYDDFVPLFIRGGSIIMRQNVTNVLTTLDLNNHYYVVIAVMENESVGNILDLPNYSDQTIADNCQHPNNCVLNITFIVKSNQAILRIVRADDGSPPKYPLYIDRLHLYGFPRIHNIKCESALSLECESVMSTHQYNSVILINDGIGIEFGQQTGVNEIIISI